MLGITPNKRKSGGQQNDSPQFAKKLKSGATPKKPNGTPQHTPNQPRKQNQTPKPNTPGKGVTPGKGATPGKGVTPGKKQLQIVSNIKSEPASPAAKTPKLEKFSGTTTLNSSPKVNIKKDPANIKKEIVNAGKQKQKGKPTQNATGDSQERINRHKVRRDRLKYKRVESRRKFKELIQQVADGDAAARQAIEEKISELEKLPQKSKNCLKKISKFQRLLAGKITPKGKNDVQQKKNQKTVGKLPAAPQKQKNKQKQPIAPKPQQQPGGKQKVKAEKIDEDSDADEDDSVEETSDDAEEMSAKSSEDDEDVEKSSDEDDDDEEASEDDDDEGSDVEDEGNSENGEGDSDDEDSESDNEVPQKNKQSLKKQGANKNKANINGDEVTGKKSRYVVFAGNLPYTASKEELTEHFKKAGEIVDIRIPTDPQTKKPRGFAYIELKNEDSYQRALSLNHTSIGGRRINVLYTQGGKKKSETQKVEMKAKNLKLQAMRKQGKLAGSVKEDQKRSVRRAKKQKFEKSGDSP